MMHSPIRTRLGENVQSDVSFSGGADVAEAHTTNGAAKHVGVQLLVTTPIIRSPTPRALRGDAQQLRAGKQRTQLLCPASTG